MLVLLIKQTTDLGPGSNALSLIPHRDHNLPKQDVQNSHTHITNAHIKQKGQHTQHIKSGWITTKTAVMTGSLNNAASLIHTLSAKDPALSSDSDWAKTPFRMNNVWYHIVRLSVTVLTPQISSPTSKKTHTATTAGYLPYEFYWLTFFRQCPGRWYTHSAGCSLSTAVNK